MRAMQGVMKIFFGHCRLFDEKHSGYIAETESRTTVCEAGNNVDAARKRCRGVIQFYNALYYAEVD